MIQTVSTNLCLNVRCPNFTEGFGGFFVLFFKKQHLEKEKEKKEKKKHPTFFPDQRKI